MAEVDDKSLLKRVFSFLDKHSWGNLAATSRSLYSVSRSSVCHHLVYVDAEDPFTPQLTRVQIYEISEPVDGREQYEWYRSWGDRVERIHLDVVHAFPLDVLPKSLRELTFGDRYDHPLPVGHLPGCLKCLVFDSVGRNLGGFMQGPVSFNQTLEFGVLPPGLTHLTLSDCFDRTIEPGGLPASLVFLQFGTVFNRPLDVAVLPPSLLDLRFCGVWNHPISQSTLPKLLQRLQLGYDFCSSIDSHALPSTLCELNLGVAFDQPLVGDCIPTSLKRLICMSDAVWLTIADQLPRTITEVVFDYMFNLRLPCMFDRTVCALPSSLKSLALAGAYNQPLDCGVLPQSLTCLRFGSKFNQPLNPGVLPDTLVRLEFDAHSEFDQPLLVGSLPSSLVDLVFGPGSAFNQPLCPGVFPPLVTSVNFACFPKFNQAIEPGVLPLKQTTLVFGTMFNHVPMQGSLYPSVLEITFGEHFNQPLHLHLLPSSLRFLGFSKNYKQPLVREMLPLSLSIIKLLGVAYDVGELFA
jgi:hypothetical protein